MMTFASIEPGVLGRATFRLTAAEVSEWTALFPSDAGASSIMPRGMIAVVVMRAFMEIMHERPRGNIHAVQSFLVWALPCIGDLLVTQLRCLDKTFKNDRRWITFETNTRIDRGRSLFRGRMKILWAA